MSDPDQAADPVTEEIDLTDADAAEAVDAERRYTAPGFDAGSTQIIDRVPDAPTEFIARARSAPQAVAARGTGRRGWLTTAILGTLVLLAAVVLGTVVLKRSSAAMASQQDKVRSTIQTFDNAIQQGDLATLRSITCGQTRDNYVDYDDRSWAETYSKVLAARQYPVVASIDEVVIDGDHAEANVTSYMAYDPAVRSTRSFDLQFRDDQWKICQSS